LFARAGKLSEAQAALALAARIDLDDVSRSAAGGVHIAAMGSVWQARVLGFGGAAPRGEVLELDPRLPRAWQLLEFRLGFRGAKLCVRVTAQETVVTTDQPAQVSVAGSEPVTVGPRGHHWERR
jgi:trehalose/maltose hydrolase-like predicted phosphorylase